MGKQKREPVGQGHNIGFSGDQLRSFVQRVERIEEKKRALGDDLKVVYAEAKSAGFDCKVIRAVVLDRRADPDALREFLEVKSLYVDAIGAFVSTPLGAHGLSIIEEVQDEVARMVNRESAVDGLKVRVRTRRVKPDDADMANDH